MFEDELVKYKDSEHFMEIIPIGMWEHYYRDRYIRDELDMITSAMPLRVIQSSGVDVVPDVDVNITDLNQKSGVKYKHFHSTGDGGITFKVDVYIKDNDSWGYGNQGMTEDFWEKGQYHFKGARHLKYLKFWYKWMYPLYVVSDAVDIPNGKYILSDNPNRKQTHRGRTVWSLEFTTYNPLDLKKYEAWESVSKYTGKSSAKNTTLKDCFGLYHNFIYSPDKAEGTTTQCTRWLQEKLYELGFMDYTKSGWYNNEVYNAVMRFQEKFQYYFEGMKVTGLMDETTLKAICSM